MRADFVSGVAERLGVPLALVEGGLAAVLAVILFLFAAVSVMLLVWVERKFSADLQSRYGPNRTGPVGLLQTVADTAKLLFKEDIVPRGVDRWVFLLAPIVVFVPGFLAYLVIPFGPGLIARDLNVGLLYFLAVPSIGVIGIIMAGWGSHNKYSMLGGLRSAAQIISYEIPRSLSVLGVIMLAGSLSTVSIVNAQARFWYVLVQPLGFLIYFIASIAEVNRIPFDLPEAENELVAGFFTEYSGLRWSFFMMAEYVGVFAAAAMGVVLFFGGWKGLVPETFTLPSVLWFLVKSYVLVLVMIWMRWTFPRFRIDHMMDFCWKVLLPLSLLNIAITAVVVLLI